MNSTRPIRCIAIDDEPLALSVISRFCERKGGMELSVYSEPLIGMEAIAAQKPDLVFLDVEMDDITGLEIASRLPENTCFIFTTAYLQYALDGYELDAVDYLHKPFSYERFEKAVNKALKAIDMRRQYNVPQNNTIVVKQEYASISIKISDIVYVEAMENYSKIYRQSGNYVLTRNNLKSIMEMLPQGEFLRVHRSYIVSLAKVESFTKKELVIAGGKTVPIGRQYAQLVSSVLSLN